MSFIYFKLTKHNDLTRRISFPVQPNWLALSSRITSLYNISLQHVGVSYVDNDGDEVTLSSEEELQDFYATHTIDRDIKFSVRDLDALRSDVVTSRPPSATHQPIRNTFGGHETLPLVFEIDDEWQRVPGDFGRMFMHGADSGSPHAFVEVLDSDVSMSRDSAADKSDGSDLTFTTPREDKGKERARLSMRASVQDDVSSAGSVIGDESPVKPPVHVFDMNKDVSGTNGPILPLPPSGTVTPAQAESTPIMSSQKPLAEDKQPTVAESAPDPPLPTFTSPANNNVTATLSNDIATLLNTISTVVSSHPELSEGIRNIVSNATNGTYWAAHRDAMSRAAGDFTRGSATGSIFEENIRLATEEAAGARVAEAVGRVMRAFGQGPVESRNENASSTEAVHDLGAPAADPQPYFLPFGRRVPWAPASPAPPFGRFPPPGPQHRPSWHNWRPMPPPPPARNLPCGNQWSAPPPPPPPRLWGPPVTPWNGGHPAHPSPRHANHAREAPQAPPFQPHPTSNAIPTIPPTSDTLWSGFNVGSETRCAPTAEELRAEVERAKTDYKARKEAYRQMKQEIKQGQERNRNEDQSHRNADENTSTNIQATTVPGTVEPSTAPNELTPSVMDIAPAMIPEPVAHIVSNARGPYPQLEMFSVPRHQHHRSHTIGHPSRSGEQETREDRAIRRITRKLADMGFTEAAYPSLPEKVRINVRTDGSCTKETEDDIVTTLLEELLQTAPSGSGTQERSIPGSWN